MLSDGGDHESWDDDQLMIDTNNDMPMPVVRIWAIYYIHPVELSSRICRILTIVNLPFILQLSYMSKDDSISDQEKKGTIY